MYDKISSHVRVAACWLDDEKTAAGEVDVSSSFLPR